MGNLPRRNLSDMNRKEAAELLEEVRVFRAQGMGKVLIARAIGYISPRTAQTLIEKLERESEPERETIVTNPIEVDDPSLIALERENTRLRDDVKGLQKKLTASHRDENLFLELAGLVREELQPLSPVPSVPQEEKRSATSVDAVLLLSDEHGDQVIQSANTWGLEAYDFNIFRCRLDRLVTMVESYSTRYLPAHKIERLWVFKLGDSIQGNIHQNDNHFQNSLKAALAVGDAEAQAIQYLSRFYQVNVVCVSGNHPRQTKKKDYEDPHNNLDFVVATQIATRLQHEIKAKKVNVYAPRAYTALVEVQNHLWVLNHGDDVRSWAGFPWYGFSRKNNRVQRLLSRKELRASFFAYGHFHTSVRVQEADAESIHAGNWTLTDPYALERIGVGSEPVQELMLIHPEQGRILDIPIKVRDVEREASYREGGWDPRFGRHLVIDQLSPELESSVISA